MIVGLAEQLTNRSNRLSRRDAVLDCSAGLYALFLKLGSALPSIPLSDGTLIYLGKAAGKGGLKSRCHFNGGTRNHSPRKSLAVLLENQLKLVARPIANPDGSYKTWALDRQSEAALDQWMHANLDVAYATARGATSFEAQLIDLFNPAINLNGCHQTDGHRLIKQLRRRMDERMKHCLS